jgi:hypothetical protein
MASYLNFYLDLEATGEIITPNYTTTEATTHIRFVSDYEIAEIYNIKVVDTLGIEHNFTSLYPNSSEYTLETVFTDFPLGMTTVYASIRDKVGNTADLTPKTFEILKVSILLVAVSDSQENKPTLSDSRSYTVSLSDEGNK